MLFVREGLPSLKRRHHENQTDTHDACIQNDGPRKDGQQIPLAAGFVPASSTLAATSCASTFASAPAMSASEFGSAPATSSASAPKRFRPMPIAADEELLFQRDLLEKANVVLPRETLPMEGQNLITGKKCKFH